MRRLRWSRSRGHSRLPRSGLRGCRAQDSHAQRRWALAGNRSSGERSPRHVPPRSGDVVDCRGDLAPRFSPSRTTCSAVPVKERTHRLELRMSKSGVDQGRQRLLVSSWRKRSRVPMSWRRRSSPSNRAGGPGWIGAGSKAAWPAGCWTQRPARRMKHPRRCPGARCHGEGAGRLPSPWRTMAPRAGARFTTVNHGQPSSQQR